MSDDTDAKKTASSKKAKVGEDTDTSTTPFGKMNSVKTVSDRRTGKKLENLPRRGKPNNGGDLEDEDRWPKLPS